MTIKEKAKKREPKPSRFYNCSDVIKKTFESVVNKEVKTHGHRETCKNLQYTLTASNIGIILSVLQKIDKEKVVVGSFYINSLEGCDGVAVLYYLSVGDSLRGRGYGRFLHNLAEKIAYELGFYVIQGTIIAAMKQELSLIKSISGWKRVYTFKNANSYNTVHSYMKSLR